MNSNKRENIRLWFYRNKALIIALIIIIIPSIILFFIYSPQIAVEPQKLDLSLSPGENFTKTISIGAIGRGDIGVTLVATEPIDKWVNLSKYLFCWDNVPGKDNETLLRVLREDFDINRAENANISKSEDGKTLNITKGYNSTQIKIDEKKGKATLKISDGKIHNLKVKKENGKRNIYLYYSKINITEVDDRTKYFNVNLNISQNTTPGEYRGAIQIWDNDKVKAEIPVFIKIHKTMVQIVGIEAPLKVNKSEYFKITAKIKNIGDYDALGVTASVNSTEGLVWAKWESNTEKIPIIHKNEEISADWWFVANETEANETEANETADWAIITVNLTTNSDNCDTEKIPVKIVNSKKSS